VVTLTVGALGRGGETTTGDRAQVPTFWTGEVRAPVFVSGVVKGAERADWMGSSAPLLDMAKLPTVPTLRAGVRGVRPFDLADAAEEV